MKCSVILALSGLLLIAAGCGKEKKTSKAAVSFSGPAGMVVSCGKKTFDKLDFKMTPGSRIFKFTAPGYAPEWKKVVIRPDDRKVEIKVAMTPWQSAALITCRASGGKENFSAEVQCDGVPVGVTPCLITNVGAGKHKVVCSRTGYAESSLQWEQDSARPKPAMNLELFSVIGKLIVQSEPKGAAISISGQKGGLSPFSCDLEAGKYEIVARAEKYLPERRWVEIRRGEEKHVTLTLKPRPAELKINSVPAGAVVTVNGEKRGTTPCRLENLAPGNYRIVWTKPGFEPYRKVVEVLAGSAEELSPALSANSGAVKLIVRPVGIDVSVDGRPLGRTEPDPERKGETKPIVVGGLSGGEHLCVISHPRANPQQKKIAFTVTKGKTLELKPVDLWIANCILEYSDNEPQRGALLYENEDSLMFSPTPGITVEVKRSMLKKITMIDVNER